MQENWQHELKNTVHSCCELIKLLNLDPTNAKKLIACTPSNKHKYKLKVPQKFINKINKSDLNDPLLRQILPTIHEDHNPPHYNDDPIAENKFIKVPGLIHKYFGRILLIISENCAMNCRFCFRKHFLYKNNCITNGNFCDALNYISNDTTISEVIFSGGDPLTKTDTELAIFAQKLSKIKHLKTLRIHSRMPIILPNRITKEFINWFTNLRLNPVLVLHCNHANEIDDNVIAKCKLMKKNNITLLNQTVLLKGINDKAIILKELNEKLFQAGVMPYYVHLLDPITGSNHFEVPKTLAKNIHKELKAMLPGYLVPKFVKEIPNTDSKTTIS